MIRFHVTWLISLAFILALAACGQSGSKNGIDSGIPVMIQSASYKPSGATPLTRNYLAPGSALNGLFHASENSVTVDPITTVSDLRFCAQSVSINHQPVSFTPALIDVTSGKFKTWGQLVVPKGIKAASIEMQAVRGCGADYSVSFNGITTSEPVEFRWKLDTVSELEAGNTLTVFISTAVIALRHAGDLNTLSAMKTHLESIEDSARKN